MIWVIGRTHPRVGAPQLEQLAAEAVLHEPRAGQDHTGAAVVDHVMLPQVLDVLEDERAAALWLGERRAQTG